MSRGTGLFRVASQGLCRPFLKTFAVNIPDPTDRPWVSKDGDLCVQEYVSVRFISIITLSLMSSREDDGATTLCGERWEASELAHSS